MQVVKEMTVSGLTCTIIGLGPVGEIKIAGPEFTTDSVCKTVWTITSMPQSIEVFIYTNIVKSH